MTPLRETLRQNAEAVRALVIESGGSNVRVFGSVATSADTESSDIDLLFTMNQPLSLMQIAWLEKHISDLLGVRVDLVPESALMPHLRDRVLSEAVPI